MTILGIDISKWNGNWNAEKAKQAGTAFVFIKASQATFTDSQFSANWKKAKDAGILRGAFHYLDYSKPAVDQANYFADLLKDDPGELPPTVDYEQARSDNNPSIALGFLRGFLDQMIARKELYQDARVKCPMIYTGPGFWAQYGDQTKRDYWLQFPLWLAHWTSASAPLLPAPWVLWVFWQFTAKGPGEVFGSESLSIDMNRFNGTLNELMEFSGRRTQTGTLVELCQNLEKRTAALETALAALAKSPSSPDANLLSRLQDLEQSHVVLSKSVAGAQEAAEKRFTSIESKIASLALPSQVVESNLNASCKIKALNVRSGPGTSFPIIGNLTFGQQVKVLKTQNGWAQLDIPAGWAYEGYLAYEQSSMMSVLPIPELPPAETSNTSYGVCNTSGLNVRSGPGAAFPIVGGLTYGQSVKILSRRNGWAQVDNPAGWSNENYLSFS